LERVYTLLPRAVLNDFFKLWNKRESGSGWHQKSATKAGICTVSGWLNYRSVLTDP
jgi:hypothetical protein